MENLLQPVAAFIDLGLILLVISIGEIIRRYWKTNKIHSFYKVFLTTLPLTIIYILLSDIEYNKAFLSYFFAFWIYPMAVKPILTLLKLNRSYNKKDSWELPIEDDED